MATNRFLSNHTYPRFDFPGMAGKAPDDFDFRSLGRAMDCNRNFNNAGIIYFDGLKSISVRPSRVYPNNQSGVVTHIVVSKAPVSVTPYSAGQSLQKAVSTVNVGNEIASTAMSCGAMVITAAIAFFGGATVPLTAGASGALVALGIAGTIATGAQCINGVYRLIDIQYNDGRNVEQLDSTEWYVATSTALDLISLASAVGALKEAVLTWKAMKSISSAKANQWLKSLSRPERGRLTELIIRAENPGISNKELKALSRAGLYPKRFPVESVQNELRKQLANTVTSALAFSGSAVSGVIASPGSIPGAGRYVIGTIQSLAVTR